MKKFSLVIAGLMMFGFAYAGEGKSCCKKGEKCNKEAKCGDKKSDKDSKACCKKGEGHTKTPTNKK